MKRALRDGGVLLVFVLLTLAMTWPWAAHVKDTSFDAGDSYLNAWTLAWDFHQTFRDPLHLFDANIFYPYRDTLAFSEHQWGIALLFFPAFAAGLAPLTVHGLAMLFAFAFSGFGAFRLARTLGSSTGGAWVAAVAFAFVPYRFHHLPHLQYVMAGWLALLAEAAVLFGRDRTWRRAAWLGAAFLMSGLSSIHWFVLGGVPVLATGLLAFRGAPPEERRAGLVRALAAVGAASLLLVPFFLPYVRASRAYGFRRGYEEVASYSARLVHWITPDWNLKVWHDAGMGETPPQGEFCLFPGLVLLALAAGGAWTAFARKDGAARTGLLWAALGFVGSFGMRTPFHALLFLALPPFRAIRVPARWAMIADLGLALLAGAAVAALAARAKSRSARAFVATGACALLLAEDRVAPMYLHRGRADPDPLSRALAATPMTGGLFQLPDEFGEINTRYVLRSADHWKPLVNAYSGFQTPLAEKLHALLRDERAPELLDALEAVPVSYVTVRRAGIPAEQRAPIAGLLAEGARSGRLRFVRRFPPGDDLFAVVKIEPGARTLEFLPPDRPVVRGPEADLTGSVDVPAAGETVHGTLTVSGWARIPGEDLGVEILIDRVELPWLSAGRAARPDVEAAVPGIGDCARAGYTYRYRFDPDDAGPHEIVVVFHAKDGRERHYAGRPFVWNP